MHVSNIKKNPWKFEKISLNSLWDILQTSLDTIFAEADGNSAKNIRLPW